MPPRLEFMAGFFGCLYGRAIAIPAYPLRPNQSLSRLEAIVADAQAKLILTTKPLLLYRTYAVPLYMAHEFVFFKILPLQLVPLRKS